MRWLTPFLLSLVTFSHSVVSQAATPNNVVCFQEIIGSNSNYSVVDASVSAWASKLVLTLGLSGDVHQWVDWAQVPDRNSFENGCDGPYQTVADVFVHISTTSDNFDSISSALESFIAANPWTSQPSIACGARSVVTYLPGCGKIPATSAPTTPRGGNPTPVPTEAPTPSNVVCYQTIIGSSASEAQVDASVEAWAKSLEAGLGLSGDVHQYVDWALVPDRTSFENGCNGPYATVVDVFVHIQTSDKEFASVSAALEAWVAAHPITGEPDIECAARSVTTFLPTCGQAGGSPTQAATTAPTEAATTAPTQAATTAPTQAATTAPTQAATTAPTQAATTAPTQAATTAPTEAATTAPTQAATTAPTQAATSAPTQAATSGPTESVPTNRGGSPTGAPTEVPTPNNILCYQEIIGSKSDFAAVDASIAAWANELESALGLAGDVHQWVDWAQVPDRTSFENGCDGPYTTVADVFVHIETSSDAFDALSAKLEAFVASHPWTSQPDIACGARSIVTFLPGCGKQQTGSNPTPVATTAPTTAPTTAATTAPTTAATTAPTTASTTAPTTAPTEAATTAPTTASTTAPTTAPTSSIPTSGPSPTPANVVCYQSIFGSNESFAVVSASIEAWANKLETALGLSGDVHQYVDWAQVPDRTSFETCPGPYATVADVFVHIPTTSADFDALTVKLEAFVLANPISAQPSIVCAARSVTTFLPTCGKVPTGGNPPGGAGTGCYQVIVGSLNGTWSQVESELSAWANKLESALGLTGDVHQYVDWAQVPDRKSFENGCDGPYETVADIFVHIQTKNYNTLVANIASFAATNSFVSVSTGGVINCAAVGNTTVIPICGLAPIATDAAAGSNDQTQSSTSGASTITITGSVIMTLVTLLYRGF